MDQNDHDQDVLTSHTRSSVAWLPLVFLVLIAAIYVTFHKVITLKFDDFLFIIIPFFFLAGFEDRIEISRDTIKQTYYWAGKVRIMPPKIIALTAITRVSVYYVAATPCYVIYSTTTRPMVIRPSAFTNGNALINRLLQDLPAEKLAVPHRTHPNLDIGQRPMIVALIGVILGELVHAAKPYVLHNLHTGSDSMTPFLLVAAPLSLWLSYRWIKADQKSSPFTASLFVAIIPALALAYGAAAINQWHAEHHGLTTSAEFIYASNDKGCQIWRPLNTVEIQLHSADGGADVCATWHAGYTPSLTQGARYRIAIVRGHLNDISFPADAFKNAILIKQASHTAPVVTTRKLLNTASS